VAGRPNPEIAGVTSYGEPRSTHPRSSSDVLEADGYLLGTRTIGLLRGALKHSSTFSTTRAGQPRGGDSWVYPHGQRGKRRGPSEASTPSRMAGLGEAAEFVW